MIQLIFLVLFFSFSLFSPSTIQAQSALGQLAAQLQPGAFAELTGMNNWNNGNIMVPCGTSMANSLTQYANKAVWNPIARRFQFVGSPHDNAGCPTTNVRGVYYDEVANTWGVLPTPLGSSNQPQHSYDQNTINPTTGEHFFKHYNSRGLQKLVNGAGSWTGLASVTMSSYQCCTALAWFPDYLGGRLIWVDGDWGVWSWTPGNPGSWTQLARGNGSDGSSAPSLPMASYNVFAHYSSLCQCVVFGGGSGFYKLNSNGTFTTLTLSGGPSSPKVGPGGESIVTEPVTGKLIFIDQTTMYEFNPQGSGGWSVINASRPSFFNTAGSVAESLISAPISNYGVIMYVKCDDSSMCRTYLYKHSSSGTTPPPPSSFNYALSNGGSVSITQGQSTSNTINATLLSGTAASAGFAVSGLPSGATGTFSQTTCSPTCTTTLNLSTLSSTPTGNHSVTVTSVAGSVTRTSSFTLTVNAPSTPPPTGSSNFQTRCSQPGVIKCVAFDSSSDLAGVYGNPSGIIPGTSAAPQIDSTVKASGAGSLKFTIPSQSGSNAGGTYFTNFSNDLSVQFGENSDFYIQWRQRFSPEMISIVFRATGGGNASWKQSIIGTGDQTGCTSSGGPCYSSCSDLEVTTTNNTWGNFPVMYNSCSGSASHGPYDGFYQAYSSPWNGANFKLENAMPSPYCLYDNQGASRLPPTGNCFPYVANEWMTFQVRIRTGPRVNNEFSNSFVELWGAREGQPSQQILNWGPYNLTAGAPTKNQKFGKIWLLPYMTNKDGAQVHATAYTWYDELIISQNKIADPGSSQTTTQPPVAPSNLSLK